MSWLLSTRKGLFEVSDEGIRCAGFAGIPVTLSLARQGTWWAAIEHGHYGPKLHRSTDRGLSWTELRPPTYPPSDEEDGPSVRTIWALEAEGQRLWCGTIPGGLFTSDDGGDSWRLVRSLWDRPERQEWFGGGADEPGIHSICIDPREPARVSVGISCGGVWHSEDAGGSWELEARGMRAPYMPAGRQDEANIQDPHRIVACAADPDIMWCQHHAGAYRSTDRGRSWTPLDVPPSSFGFAVAADPTDPLRAWFVPAVRDDMRIPVDAALVVARTRDGGRSFEVLREGLPQRHAYDLVYRHALAVGPTGQRLAFGSTTGSMWTSADAGESWRARSHHLPPIYAVQHLP